VQVARDMAEQIPVAPKFDTSVGDFELSNVFG